MRAEMTMQKNMKIKYKAKSHAPVRGEASSCKEPSSSSVLYQPLVDIDSGAVAGFSASAAGAGFPVANKSDCSISLAMDGISGLLADGQGLEIMLAGVDPWGKDHNGAGILDLAPGLVARYGESASKIVVLFSVDSLMERPADALDLGISLKRHGLGVGVDNLEPGAAPYNFLEMFPADFLRLRLDEIAGYAGDEEYRQWLPEVSAFAANLLMEMAVAGVENARQYRLLKALGCRYAQGGYFSKPLAVDGVREFVRSAGISPYLLGG